MDVNSLEFPENKEQIEILKEFIRSNPDSQEMKRALATKLVLEGYRYQTVQQILAVSSGFISKWVNAFKFSGLQGLKSRHQGTKGFLSQSERAETIQWLIEQKAWDISELEVYLIDRYDVVFQSRQSYYQLLKESRITWQKGEQVNPRYDEELTQKKIEKLLNCWREIEPT